MREDKRFAERTRVLKSDEVLKKFFLVYEGTETEAIYFAEMLLRREDIGISPLIELIPLIRSFSEEGWSNPKKILDRVIENINEKAGNRITYDSLMNRIMDYFDEAKIITGSKVLANRIWDTMHCICSERLHKKSDDEVEDLQGSCDIILRELESEYEIINIVEGLSEIISNGGLTYEEGFDRICLIVDRDRESFVSNPKNNQYEYVMNKCSEKGFYLCVTNPCFEFWLLLHFDEVFDLDKERLLENPKVTAKRRYAEDELRKISPGYRKNKYDAGKFMQRIDRAIENEKGFCEDLEGLEHSVGSNLGKLIEVMRKDNAETLYM